MLACIRCGACLTSCPTYVLSLEEAEGPRGRVGMARAVAEGHLALTPDLLRHEMNCLVCDACTAVCPAGVHMDPLQVVFRGAVSETRRLSRVAQIVRAVVFGWLFMDMRRFRAFARAMWLYQRSGMRWLARHLGILRAMHLAEAEQLLPAIPRSFVTPRGETYPSQSDTPTPVAFFAGCIMATALADVDRATIRVLQRSGCSVSNPSRQGCCGALHAHGGDLPRALELAKRNIEAFEVVEGPIVVNSAGCGAMLKDYAHHLRNDPAWSARARDFSERVRDLSQVVTPAALEPRHAIPQKVVYQDACHLIHAQRISRQPRALLAAIPGVELVEIDEAGLCCGSAGVYNVTNPVESKQLQQRKVDNALKATPDLIVTGNPGCLLQLRSGLSARASDIPVKHLAEVLDEASAP
ncbi:MAG: (Fe-S)-binding protein [Chloroflexi bacterium]|nr:(Fe-S)-binding protein [Chloroflexota bacterium]